MEWLTIIKSSIDYIERNIKTIKDIDEVSKSLFVSTYYLSTGFLVMTGYNIKEYIRNRRLYLAALDLCKNNIKVIDVALDYGYETHESFTKAFTRFHGFAPSKTKENKNNIHIFNPLTIDITIKGGNKVKLEYKVTPMFALKIIGFAKQFDYEDSQKKIPLFWDEICTKYCYPRIYKGLPAENKFEKAIMDNCIGEFGVCIDDEKTHKLLYIIGGRYTGGDVPEGMTLVEFERGDWAVFDSFGPCPSALQSLTNKIYKEFLPLNKDFELRKDASIEWYDCTGDQNSQDYHTQIWLPIKKI